MRIKRSYMLNGSNSSALMMTFGVLAGMTAIAGVALSASTVSADDDSVVDEINITVPISCTLSGTGMNTHNAEIANGTVNSNIGETTMKAFCNDNEGFAIYAIGYTDNTDGKNVLASSTAGSTHDIATGTATSGNNSNWAMKLSTVTSPTPTYPITIQNSFDAFHTVPDDYTLVAKRTASTDIGTNAEGSTLKSTYQAYISSTQPADTYTGQVKYILVHPNNVDANALKNAVTVVFDGNGLTFPNGASTNTVKYAEVCQPGEYVYVGNTYQEVMTSNIATGGTQNGSYTDSESILQPITLTGADKVKVVIEYGVTEDTMGIIIAEGSWDGDWNTLPENYYEIYTGNNVSGTESYFFEGNTVTIFSESWAAPESGYDKGFYAKVYPVYNTEQPGSTGEELPGSCTIQPISGTYAETTTWNGKWLDGNSEAIANESELANYIEYNYDSIKGTTISLLAHNPYTLKYNGNGASGEFGMGTQKKFSRDLGYIPEELYDGYNITLLAPNYKRTGYGFIGWSTDASAASHLNTATLYGPNETITVDETLLSTANDAHEVTLYAIWLASAGNIQNWSGCSSMNVGDTVALTDTRDSNTYAVAKLADGNCWMIENLRLGGTNPMTLTTANTQSAGTLPGATTTWSDSDTAQNLEIENTLSPLTEVDRDLMRNYAFGNFYSWATAINSTALVYNTGATTSICPAGWSLPSAGIYNTLRNAIQYSGINESEAFRSYPYNYVFSGYVHRNVVSGEGQWSNALSSSALGAFGQYWTSSAAANPSAAYRLFLNRASVSVSESANGTVDAMKKRGSTVRCVLGS